MGQLLMHLSCYATIMETYHIRDYAKQIKFRIPQQVFMHSIESDFEQYISVDVDCHFRSTLTLQDICHTIFDNILFLIVDVPLIVRKEKAINAFTI